jgi:hypothetical protein
VAMQMETLSETITQRASGMVQWMPSLQQFVAQYGNH